MKRTTADAAVVRHKNDWRAKDRDLFRSVIGTDEVTHDDKSVSVDAFYEALRERLDWPGKYLDEIDGRGVSGVDSYLESPGIERLDGWGPQLDQVARSADPWAADNDEDQKRLEEKTCKNCGVAESRHDRWTAAHPFVAKKRTPA